MELTDFSELILAGDLKYLRFIDKKTNRLYLIEYYTKLPLEVTIEDLLRFNSIDDVKKYFGDANVFEFFQSRELKQHIETIKSMSADEKKQLTLIVKEIKNLEIAYINFTYFFVETKDRKLYYAKINKKTGLPVLKNLKIDIVIKPADMDIIMRDIKAYGAFKYHNMTIKYDDIKEYIENPLLKPREDLNYVINYIRDYELLKDKNTKKNIDIKEDKITDEEIKSNTDELSKLDNTDIDNSDTYKFDLDKTNDMSSISDSKKKKEKKPKKKKHKEGKFKGSLFMYCLIGFTAGVLLAAITIVIGSFI